MKSIIGLIFVLKSRLKLGLESSSNGRKGKSTYCIDFGVKPRGFSNYRESRC